MGCIATCVNCNIKGKDVDIRNAAFLRENVIIGDNCVVGNSCELKNTLMFNDAKAPHFNYVGDTVMGYKVCTPKEIKDINPDYVLVSAKYYIDIMETLYYETLKGEYLKGEENL